MAATEERMDATPEERRGRRDARAACLRERRRPSAPAAPPDAQTELSRRTRRAAVGRVLAPLAALAVYAALPGVESGLSDAGRAVAAVGVLMGIAWVTEALPLPATALLPIVAFPLLGVSSVGEATAPYASDIIYLFMGGFMLALAMQRWGLHRRIALRTVLVFGTRPTRLIGGFMVATAFLSMWVSNTATTVMMLPIGVSVLGLVLARLGNDEAAAQLASGEHTVAETVHSKFAVGLMLGIAYAASIGSLGTLIGTPPNLFMAGFLEEAYGIDIGFGRWMAVGLPLAAVFLVIAWLLLTRVLFRPEIDEIPGGRELIREELSKVGPLQRGEWGVGVVFVATALLWMLREPLTSWAWLVGRLPAVERLTDPGIAIAAAVALFAIPVSVKRAVFLLDWETAKQLPWGVLILFGGGLSLASAVSASGLDAWIGQQVSGLGTLPVVVLVAAVVALTIALTELTSNTATAATFLPILGGVAVGLGLDPLLLVIPAALAATCAFMLPVATPPNVIVFGSGHVRMVEMVRAGIWLNLAGVVLITAVMYTVAAGVFGIALG